MSPLTRSVLYLQSWQCGENMTTLARPELGRLVDWKRSLTAALVRRVCGSLEREKAHAVGCFPTAGAAHC